MTAPRLTLASVAAFLVLTTLVHFFQPHFDPIEVAVSYYMNGPRGWLLSLALSLLSLASVALLAALRPHFPPRARRWPLHLLALWSAACLLGAQFPPDPYGQWNQPPSPSGLIHAAAALVAFLAFPIAAVTLSRAVAALALLRPLAWACALSLFVLFACLAPVFANHAPYALGLIERILLALYAAWIAAAAALTPPQRA
ncbi:MAG: DUF998 domain-containing protein [Bryobacterales bacterium]|nr:DUF998 domain-containing protein [Bryobacterales bacterium]